MVVERLHIKLIWISAVVSALAAAPLGWIGASFEMGRSVAINSSNISLIQKDIEVLKAAEFSRVTREEFQHMQEEQAGHWSEQHDFYVRQDQRTMEIIREHARLFARFEGRKGNEGEKPK